MNEKLGFSVREAAESLGLCVASIYNLRDRGDLRIVKLGRRSIVPASEIQRILGQSESAPRSDRQS